ncbi:VTT domain-containing protein [Galbitalea soli]|uniref:VTT domain-containing protein n=1 Tax=Galbitalea soli TaxID=1268042 RepID=A0A7C9PMA9_9MICO|nr:hypothetical protein [Galbitalea soli]NYJ31510.1 membrane protein DedA with SNARE-associated domain [Galbitalea soli]
MSSLTEFISVVAQSPWAFVLLAALLVVDGFFPFVPGETVVVALATLGAAGHGPSPVAVFLVATAATMVGDGIAFAIGRTVGIDRWAWMRHPRSVRALAWTAGSIERRPMLILVVAKYLPYARVAVTMTAGASDLRVRRYLTISLVASALYTGYHVIVAVTAGTLLARYPLLALAASIGFGLVTGLVTAGVRALRTRFARRSGE